MNIYILLALLVIFLYFVFRSDTGTAVAQTGGGVGLSDELVQQMSNIDSLLENFGH